jgi:hypothetical protein
VSPASLNPTKCGEMRVGVLKPVPNRVPDSHSVAASDDAATAEVLHLQDVCERSGVGVEPTHRWATPVSPVLKLCYETSTRGLKRGFGLASVPLGA